MRVEAYAFGALELGELAVSLVSVSAKFAYGTVIRRSFRQEILVSQMTASCVSLWSIGYYGDHLPLLNKAPLTFCRVCPQCRRDRKPSVAKGVIGPLAVL